MPKIESVAELLSSLRTFPDTSGLPARPALEESRGVWVFRGHSDTNYRLVPSVGRVRDHVYKSRKKYEEVLFHLFQRECLGKGLLETPPSDLWEWLAIAQHFGLPTRLLDFTHNPLVALYFAVCASPDRDGTLIGLRARNQSSVFKPQGDPLQIEAPIKFYPQLRTPRIRAQEGLFVACSIPGKALDDYAPGNWKVHQWLVPASSKAPLRYELYRLGVHEGSLFPNLDGLARRLAWQTRVSPASLNKASE